MRPGNPKGWGKGKAKGINGMEYAEGAFPPIGGVTHDQGHYDQQEEYGDWWSEQEEWTGTKPIGAVTRSKGKGEDKPPQGTTNHDIPSCDACGGATYNFACSKCGIRFCIECKARGEIHGQTCLCHESEDEEESKLTAMVNNDTVSENEEENDVASVPTEKKNT